MDVNDEVKGEMLKKIRKRAKYVMDVKAKDRGVVCIGVCVCGCV